ncbi:efflux RND transporter periplasmic adaptor subunit [Coralliovum pocilloporae]|uniref:efflux RND transporter periplasmic adaptor subunit n=1 Tax=Coralliovum pocilloporae TaxID=3066369 RepID=UPI003307782C
MARDVVGADRPDNTAENAAENGEGAETETSRDRPSHNRHSHGRTSWLSRSLWILGAMAVLFGVLVILDEMEDTVDVTTRDTPPPLPLVSVTSVPVAPETVTVSAFSEIRPRWMAEVRAAVSGRVLRVNDTALAGERVVAGTELLVIEGSRYKADLAAAEQALATAELTLLQARNATYLARREFERTGTKPANDLALKLPQLDIARRAVTSAEAQVAAARQQLADTIITAPFSGFVTARFVSPGQSVSVGDPLVTLADDSRFELTVELGARDWGLLEASLAGQMAEIVDKSGAPIAQAKVRQGGGFLDETTRQYKVFLVVEGDDAAKVLGGDFVRVVLKGSTVSHALDLPASALSQDGFLWHLDDKDRLRRLTPDILTRRENRLIIRAPEGTDSLRVATMPLISFLPGQKVAPTEADTDTDGEAR